ncbi:spx/MgsR family transcriptional regulator [Helicobacter didelphidarum]|uniref:Spx/MgsR family transcriptional regulator n=1 Tax=Helicobacter didelphidarum TaxID=2040648 RepID=A0A3D8IIQ5_9HELI|nr:ArsC/Spx/MgsR family protein [Helicobacter didelphidarum]RDU64930.1 spx/MgsR family transcriptional regulator [Helicobacter didelphidarum]
MGNITIYGIRNCNSMKKAFIFLETHNLHYEFVDFKKTPPDSWLLTNLINMRGKEAFINTKGTTYKKLKESGIQNISEIDEKMIIENPSIVKRPLIVVVENNKILHISIGHQEMEQLLCN